MGSAPVGVQCPFTSSIGEFPGSFRPCWCPSPFSSPSISRCFPFTFLHPPSEFIRVSSLRPTYLQFCTHAFDRPCTYSHLGEFQAWDWLWYLCCGVSEAAQRCA